MFSTSAVPVPDGYQCLRHLGHLCVADVSGSLTLLAPLGWHTCNLYTSLRCPYFCASVHSTSSTRHNVGRLPGALNHSLTYITESKSATTSNNCLHFSSNPHASAVDSDAISGTANRTQFSMWYLQRLATSSTRSSRTSNTSSSWTCRRGKTKPV